MSGLTGGSRQSPAQPAQGATDPLGVVELAAHYVLAGSSQDITGFYSESGSIAVFDLQGPGPDRVSTADAEMDLGMIAEMHHSSGSLEDTTAPALERIGRVSILDGGANSAHGSDSALASSRSLEASYPIEPPVRSRPATPIGTDVVLARVAPGEVWASADAVAEALSSIEDRDSYWLDIETRVANGES
jgi:hypothetical protein